MEGRGESRVGGEEDSGYSKYGMNGRGRGGGEGEGRGRRIRWERRRYKEADWAEGRRG